MRAGDLIISGRMVDSGEAVRIGPAPESHLFAGLFATDDRLEGTAAFAEKRTPESTGR